MLNTTVTVTNTNSITLIEDDHILDVIFKSTIIIAGVIGNATNIFVLTRNKTNITAIYLIAISTVDMLRLLSAIGKVVEFFQWIHLGYENYWKFRPILTLINFSTQAMSLYMIVSFSVNRYIAIRDITRKHFLNTKTANRCIIVVIALICALTRIYISMNIVLKDSVYYNEITHKFCKLNFTMSNATGVQSIDKMNVFEILNRSQTEEGMITVENLTTINISTLTYNASTDTSEDDGIYNCKNMIYYAAQLKTNRNRPPRWHRLAMATLFGLIPLIILIIFNTKIILLLRESNIKRKALTNSVILQQKTQPANYKAPLITKENRTILHLILIKTVIALLRLPYFIFMFFLDFIKHKKNVLEILGYVADYSLDINAVLNFFLFSILPENNRKQLFETLSKYCQCCKTVSSRKHQIKDTKKPASNLQNPTTVSGANNLGFVSDSLNGLNTISVSELPGDQQQGVDQHRKLHQNDSNISNSSSSTLESQISVTSDISLH